ncbi:MAG: phytanoyl-CoA dioxygenase family protein [Streptosporangiaceae bacterium]|nr:phytanoyl-CoA dioxygenase family protein [Streptosporangiaceae bacterium]
MSLNGTSAPYALTDDQHAAFERDGFLVVRGLMPPAVLDRIAGVFSDAVDTLALRWRDRGLITDTYAGLPLTERYLRILRDGGNQLRVHGAWRRILVSRPVFELWQRPELLGPARSLIGDELYALQAWNGRPRDPLGRTLPVGWHQDAHYYKNWGDAHGPLISVWIPLVPVDESSSCMQYVGGSHRRGRIEPSLTPTGEFVVAETEVDAPRICSAVMDPGDVVFFTDTTLHRSTPNTSDRVRWSIDIRFGRPSPGVIGSTPRGYYCFSAEDPSRVEDFDSWAARYQYMPEELAKEMTIADNVDPALMAALLRVPDVDVF